MATKTPQRAKFSSAAYLADLMEELDRAAISARIKQAREHAGLTQRELGDLLDPPVHYRSIQNYERSRVPYDLLPQIADRTRVTTAWLLYGDPVPSRVEAQADRLADAIEQLVRVLARLDERLTG